MSQCLLLGLGGTGSRIINQVAADLKKRNIEINNGKISCAVIDTNKSDQKNIEETGIGIPVLATSKDKPIKSYMSRYADEGVNDWMPISAELEPQSMTDGASQMRTKSRLAFFDTTREGNSMKELVETIDKLFEDREGGEIRVMIVSSLAGGTGSGMFIQTALWVRNYFNSRNVPVTIRGILVLPDVFIRTVDQIGRDERECRNLRANAYGAIRELNAITKLKTKSTAAKPLDRIKLDDLFDSESQNVRDGQPVFDFAFFMDDVSSGGSTLKSIVDYEKTVARLVYMQLFAPIEEDMNSEEDNLFRTVQDEDEPLFGSCGTAKAAYPVDSILEYCSLRAAKEALSTGWKKIDKIVDDKIKKEKKSENTGSKRTDPRKEYIRQFDKLSQIKDGQDKLLYSIRNDIMNAKIKVAGEEQTVELTDKIDDFMILFNNKIKDIIKSEDPGKISKIKIKDEEKKWVANENMYGNRGDLKTLVTSKRNQLTAFVNEIKNNSGNIVSDIASSICPNDMGEIAKTNPGSILGLFTKKNENGELYFVHPIAIRYLLYKLSEKFKERAKLGGQLEEIELQITEIKEEEKAFDDTKTGSIKENAENTLDKKVFALFEAKFIKEYKEKYYRYNAKMVEICEDYLSKSLESKASNLIIERIDELIRVVESFFAGLGKVSDEIELSISNNVTESEDKGRKIFYVCASKEEKECLYDSLNLRTDDSNVGVNEVIANALYAQYCVKQNPEADFNKKYLGMNVIGIFKKEVIDTYSRIIKVDYSDEIYLDLYTAICKSSDLLYEKSHGATEEDINAKKLRHRRAISDLVEKLRKASAPFLLIKGDLESGSRKRMTFWGFSPELVEACKDDRQNLGQILGVNEDSQQNAAYDKCELDCYSAVYGIKAEDIDKFNEEHINSRDNYYRSYKEVIDKMVMDVSNGKIESLVQTPHLDKTWHNILPYITPKMQVESQNKFYRSFWLAIAYGMIKMGDEGYYQIKRNVINELGKKTPIDATLLFDGKPIVAKEVWKLFAALRTDSAFLKDAEECIKKFEEECEDVNTYEETEFLRGKYKKKGPASAYNEETNEENDVVDGKKEKVYIGGVASKTDTNALSIIARYYASPKRNEGIITMLIQTLDDLCKELIQGKYAAGETEKINNVAIKLYERIYNACQLSDRTKNIDLIDRWFNVQE